MRESRKQTGKKYAQFSLVGFSNMLVDVGALNLLLFLAPTGIPEVLVLYNVAALVLANANRYLWNTPWTFRDEARHDARQAGMFTAQGLLDVAVGGPRAGGLHRSLPLGQRQRRQGLLDGGRLDGELPVPAILRLPHERGLSPDRYVRTARRPQRSTA